MKETAPKKALPRFQPISGSLYRDRRSGIFYGIKRSNGSEKKFHSLKTKVKDDAERALTDWLRDLQVVTDDGGGMNLDTLITRYLKGRASLDPGTVQKEVAILDEFRVSFREGKMGTKVRDVVHSDITHWLTEMKLAEGRNGEVRKPRTMNEWRALVIRLFELAVDDRIIAAHPFNQKKYKRDKPETPKRFVPTDEEFAKLIAEIRQPSFAPNAGKHGGQRPMFNHAGADFAEFMGRAGVGQAEMVTLVWGDVLWERGMVKYLRDKTGKSFQAPIYPLLRPLLNDLFAEAKAAGRAGPADPVFQIQNVRKALDGAVTRLGMPNFTQRSLRAYLIGMLWKKGVNVKKIAEWQGHGDGGKLIMDTYTEVFGTDDAEYVKAELAKLDAPDFQVIDDGDGVRVNRAEYEEFKRWKAEHKLSVVEAA
jgi:integrase